MTLWVLGLTFYTYRDTVTVIRALQNGPSDNVGIKGGDRIIEANGDSIFGKNWSNDAVVSKLKGEKGTKVNLKVYRPSENKILDFKVRRNDVPIVKHGCGHMLNADIGYIKINRFAESTYKEF